MICSPRLLLALTATGLLAAAMTCPAEEAPPVKSIDEAIAAGIDFLIADQNPNGSWGSARQTKGLNIYAPVPGAHDAFRVAVTAMAISALCD